MLFFVEQSLNGLQLGITLFLMSAGLTLVFGIMRVINLAHGSFYMIGAYCGATTMAATGSFLLAIGAALIGAALAGWWWRCWYCGFYIGANISIRYWRPLASFSFVTN